MAFVKEWKTLGEMYDWCDWVIKCPLATRLVIPYLAVKYNQV